MNLMFEAVKKRHQEKSWDYYQSQVGQDVAFLLETVQEVLDELAEARKDTELLDGAADIRICDGVGGIDIDEATLASLEAREKRSATEEEWKKEWRKQFRIALREAIAQSKVELYRLHE